MNARERFVDCVKNGTDKPYVSLQIGAGAGFDCKLTGKEWTSQGTIQDTIRAYEIVGCDPLLNIGLPDVGEKINSLHWNEKVERQDSVVITQKNLETPFGDIHWQLMEQPRHGITPKVYPLTSDDEHFFDIVQWYAEQMAKGHSVIGELIEPSINECHQHGAVSVQWNIQPFEMMGLASVQDLAIKAMTEPENFRKTCDLITDVNICLIREVFKAGSDFVFLGGPGAEMLSPRLYEEYIVPDSKKVTTAVHEIDGLIYSHICSPVEPFLSKGYYNQIGLDLFETLSPPPVGNVSSLCDARQILDPKMCTRGNLGLDVLLNGSIEEIEKATIEIIEATKGYKHMIAASDYLFYDIPLENVRTLVQTVENYKM